MMKQEAKESKPHYKTAVLAESLQLQANQVDDLESSRNLEIKVLLPVLSEKVKVSCNLQRDACCETGQNV
jgi:hypothetical protein